MKKVTNSEKRINLLNYIWQIALLPNIHKTYSALQKMAELTNNCKA